MRKKFIVVLATSLLLANGTSVAMASGGSDAGSDDSNSTSTTTPVTPANPRLSDAQRAAQQAARQAQNDAIAKYKAELVKYLESRNTIIATFTRSMVAAQRSFKVARESATTAQARNAAIRSFNVSIRNAVGARIAALRALGDPPTKPVKP